MTTDVGTIRAKMDLDARGFNEGLEKARQNLSESANEAKRVNGNFKQVTRALLDMGMSGKEVRKVQQELKSMRPDVVEQQMRHLEVQLRRVGATDDQIARIKNRMTDVQEETAQAVDRVDLLNSALVSLGSTALMVGLIRTVRSLADEASRASMAYQGLTEISKSLNLSVEDTTTLARELAEKGFMSITEATEAVKVALATGFNLEEARNLILALGDAAAYNRQANYGWGESVLVTLQGIKQGNSTLTDAVGVTTNLSQMYERYAATIGTTAGKLTDAQKVQAAYNGFMQDAAIYAGNAEAAMDGYAGTQARFNQTIDRAKEELGEAFLPILQKFMDELMPIVEEFTEWVSVNREVVAGVATATITVGGLIYAITSLVSIVQVLKAAFIALNSAMGPIGWVAAALSLVVIGVTAYTTAADVAADSVFRFAQSQDELNRKLNESPLTRTIQEVRDLQEDMKTLNDLLEERQALEEKMANTAPNLPLYDQLKRQIEEVDKKLSVFGINTPDDAPKVMEELQKQASQATKAIVDIERASMRETIAHADNVKEMRKLITEYDTLSASAKKTEEQKARLEQVVKTLKQEYPDLIAQLDEENVWHLKNVDALKEYVNGEENRVKATAQASVNTLTIAQTEAKERVRLAQETLKKIEEIEKKEKFKNEKESPFGPENPFGGQNSFFKYIVEKEKEKLQGEINEGNFAINEAKKLIEDLSTEDWDKFRTKDPVVVEEDNKKKNGKQKTLAEIQREQYQESLRYIEYKKNLNQMNEEQELIALNRLAEKYKKNAEIRQDLEVRVYKLKEQMNIASFQASAEWIEQEERKLTLAGKTEDEITEMKLAAWTRVRNRYTKDSELYKQADTQVYQAKVAQLKSIAKAEEEAAKAREKQNKETTKRAIDAIDKAKKAELSALDERRKAINKFYEDQERLIDDKERLRERNDLVAEMDKYRYATSEKGQKHFLELQEKLRQMDVEDQKRSLEDERDQKLEALDKQKSDIESWYDALRAATDELTGDLTALYKLADDERLKSFRETNALIIAEMNTLKTVMAAGNGTSDSAIAKMMANSAEWAKASPARRLELEEDNRALGTSLGATYNSRTGKWMKADNMPLYHTGGIAGERNFRSGAQLMPDELLAVLRYGEPVFTSDQLGSLIGSLSGSGGRGPVIIEKFMEVNNPTFEDGIDLRTFGRETGGEAAEILRKQLTGGGGID